MRLFPVIVLASLLLVACGENDGDGAAPSTGKIADTIFVGGPIWTANDAQPTVQAVAVLDGRIIHAGDEAGARALAGVGSEIINLQGAALYPGFTDAHAHLMGIGLRELMLNLEDVASIEMLQARVAAAVAEAKPGAEIIGRGWIETHWPEARFPTRQDIDRVAPDNPVYLIRADGHAGVLNSRGLALMGITADTPDPAGGQIQHGEDGQPNGLLIDAAAGPARKHFFAVMAGRQQDAYQVAGAVYAGLGWVQAQNMWYELDDLDLMEAMADDGQLRIRVYNAISGYAPGRGVNPDAEALIANGPRASKNGKIVTRAIKLYMDGALGSRGALLLAPYSDAPGNGLQLADKAVYMRLMIASLRAGIQVHMHAIGDRGNRQLLDWYEEAFAAVPAGERAVAEPRWRDEHAQIINPADIPRFAALGVIPSMQPSHAIGDLFFAPDRLGKDRLRGAYAWRSLIDSGAIIAGGSDAPVEKGDPRIEFYAAVARRALDGYSNDDWHPEEAVSRAQALKMFTLWPAYASFREDDLGSIEVGKLADFTVFSGDIMTIPQTEILTVAPLMTMVEGEIIFRAEGF